MLKPKALARQAMTEIRPIFIVGMNGSGTTVFTSSLARHKNLYGFPGESKVIPYYLSRLPEFGDLSNTDNFRRLLKDIRQNYSFTSWNGHTELPEPEHWQDIEHSLQGAINAVMVHFANRENKTRWCEKTPMNAQHIEAIAEAFPNARFIHMIRDGRDAALSFQRRFGFSPIMSIYRWKKTIQTARDQASRIAPGRYLEVRYESLSDSGEDCLRETCEFLGEDFESTMLQPRKRRGQDHEGTGFINNSQKWKQQLSASALEKLETLAGKQLHELGYETTNPLGDSELSAAERKQLVRRDQLRRTWRQTKKIALEAKNPAQFLKRLKGIVQTGLRAGKVTDY